MSSISTENNGLDLVEDAVEDIRKGKMVIVVDEEERENEGDLTMAAEKVTAESINFMATHGRGLICLPMQGIALDKLNVPLMVSENESPHETAFCVSIEARKKVSTGISAADRATTILTAIDAKTNSEDLIRPGHIFPLRARPGGVLERAGQTEAAVDLARISGLNPAGVICEIMNTDGSMARLPDLKNFRQQHGIRIVSVVDLIKFRLKTERFVKKIEQLPFSSEYGEFELMVFENKLDASQHFALIKGEVNVQGPVLVRVQVESLFSDVFHKLSDQKGNEVALSLRKIEKEGKGVFVYLRGGGKNSNRLGKEINKVLSRENKAEDSNSFTESFRDYGVGAQILTEIGLHEIKLLTNHPKRIVALEGFGLKVVEEIPIC